MLPTFLNTAVSGRWVLLIAVAICLASLVDDGGARAADRRVPWTTSRIKGSPDPPLPYVTERIYGDLELDQPTAMIPVPGTRRLIVTQLEREIVSFDRGRPGATRVSALDLTKVHPEYFQTLGIAFHPRFPEEPWCFVTYQLRQHGDQGTRLVRFRVTDTAVPRLDPGSELLLASWRNHGHRGGGIDFGPDGYLYVPIGDGNPPSPPDPIHTGQDLRDLQSSILRIDVEQATEERPYRIPPDNPFVDLPGARGEVWAYGFRNPWKISFDPRSGDLWTGDVGWELMEMVYRVEKAGNYGWSVMEGSQPVYPDAMVGPTPIQPPVVEHTHVEARSVTGGYFYYGDRLPELNGAYIYGDYMTGKIWALRYDAGQVTWHRAIADTPFQIISFALEADGEIDVIDFAGTIHRLVPNPRSAQNQQFPRRLSETGLFASTPEHRPADGVIRYAINAEHWADFTVAERLLALPGETSLSIFREDNWEVGQNAGFVAFPQDAVLAKTISLEMIAGDPDSSRRLETQLLHRDGDTWRAYNYVWSDDQADAELLTGEGRNRLLRVRDSSAPGGERQQVWHHAARNECLLCHIWRSGTVHGFKLDQLNRADPQGISQLARFEQTGIFAESLPPDLPQQISPYDGSAPLAQRARAYLHLNCAHCHRDGGGGTAAFDLREELPLDEMKLIDAQVTQGSFGLNDPKVIVPGNPYQSVLYYRLAKLGRGHMPQFGSYVADADGIRLIHDWIESLSPGGSAGLSAEQALINELDAASAEALPRLADQLLATSSGSLMLASAINSGQVNGRAAEAVVQIAATQTDNTVRDLFERFLPPEQRLERLGTSFDTAALLNRPGDARRGETLFFEGAGVECRSCHQVARRGGAVGPPLDSVGNRYRPAEILENILTPSRKIDPQYLAYYLETTAGRIIVGLLTEQTDGSVTLRDATGKDHRVERTEIEFLQPQQKSMMPEQLFRDFTPQQAADMLAFLSSLKAK